MKAYIGAKTRLTDLPRSVEKEIAAKLTLKNPAWAAANKFSPHSMKYSRIPEYVRLFQNTSDGLIVPRGFDYDQLSHESIATLTKVEVVDERLTSPVVYPAMQCKFSPLQTSVLDRFKENLDSVSGCYFIVLPVSSGKTRLGYAMAAAAGERCLILCRSSQIVEAWLSEYDDVFGPNAPRPGFIKQSIWNIGETVTIASWQTITRREHEWGNLSASHGLLIVDEVHRMPAPVMSKFTHEFAGMYKVGLTGTSGGSFRRSYLAAELGKVFFTKAAPKEETETSLPIKDVVEVFTKFRYEQKPMLDKHGHPMDVPFDLISCLRKASRDAVRNELVADTVKQVHDEGHCCLVLTQFREHADALSNMLEERNVSVATMMGGCSTEDQSAVLEAVACGACRCIVATTSFIAEGANIPPLDRLFFALSMKGGDNGSLLKQAVGRIRRKHAGKKDAIVYDFVDRSVPVLFRHYTKHRVKVYRNHLGVQRFKNIYYQ